MSDSPGDRVQHLFDQAVALPPAQRAAFLEAACAGDAPLRAEVESLLACDAGFTEGTAVDLLKSPLVRSPKPANAQGAATLPAARPPIHPLRVRNYRVLRLIAEGGMGTVYEAEQDSPHRTVALKVIRPGLASPSLLKRFNHEAQILGQLHHPGIAQVHEAGLADDGQPFFAMEFIRGLPLDEYARRHGLDVRARMSLLALVCDAVQHAHDQGVIHRDLKPANILVDETGQPKILDFGVAHVAAADLFTASGLTQTGQLLGTPSYMSPEQVTADPSAIDHRADVYALGVILFELLAHRLPYRLENRPVVEAARLILEQDPPRLGSINPQLRGDVETIVAKALEKDPARRYRSAADLAADLRHNLAHEPILARPPSALYHLRKFARRHTALVGGVLAVMAALVLGLVISILFAVGEARQRGQAEKNASEARYQTYRACMAAASAALQNHDVADADRHLKAAPEDLRGWEWRHLNSRLDDSSLVAPLPTGEGAFLLAAQDRLRVGVLTSAGVRILDLEGGEHRTVALGPEHGLHAGSVTQTRRGLRVVAWDGHSAFDLLDDAGQVLCRVAAPGIKGRAAVVVSTDGTRLCVQEWSKQRQLMVFDATSGKQTAICDGHNDAVWDYRFSPDSSRLVSASEDRTACVWDAATGTLLATCRGHTSKVLSAAFGPDGSRLVTTSADGTVRQWDARTGQEVEPPYDHHSSEVYSAVYSPDGQWVASGGFDRTVRVWQARGRQDVAVLHGHTGGVTEVAFTPDGRRLASLSSRRLDVSAGDDTVRVWDVDPRATLPVLRGHQSYVYPVAYSPDGRWLASGCWDGTVRLWDAATGEPCATLPHPAAFVFGLAFGPDGTWLVTGCPQDEPLRIWDLATARLRGEIPLPGRHVSLTVSPDGTRVAATTHDPKSGRHHLTVFDRASGKPLFSTEAWSLAYSPDGRWLAAMAADQRTVLLLDARTHETRARFSGHENTVFKAAFSPDSQLLASCSRDHTVRLWQIDSGACRVLSGHTDEVFAVAFHPDGTRLATGGRDGAVWLWDPTRREPVVRLPGHKNYVWSLAFSKDGTTLVSGSGDSTLRLWDTAPLKTRYDARREAATLRPEAERLVEQLWREQNDADKVVQALRADPGLSETLRQAALRAVLQRARPE